MAEGLVRLMQDLTARIGTASKHGRWAATARAGEADIIHG